mmetsp:Transcript_20198/g.28854  ORF Transcript_20198/g.28854 Transcript_20198/m.28854 type:complete len:507 (-) Transcript_20198:62-1582(-)
MPTSAETAIKNLSRQAGNTTCPNCGTHSKYGFSTICIKYYTFVCNNCKSSHQAISHRCKSVTMSSWEMGEVLKLKRYGNDYARKVWLATAPEVGVGGRPREGSDINEFKRFVVEVYEKKRYYRELQVEEENKSGSSQVAAATTAPSVGVSSRYYGQPSQQQQHLQMRKPANAALVNGYTQSPNWGKLQRTTAPQPPTNGTTHSIAPTAPVAAPAPAVDLLDFGAFDAAPAPSAAGQSSTPFDLFNSAPPTTTTNAVPPSNNSTPAPINTTTTTNNSNDPFGMEPSVASPNTNMKNGFDPFGVSVMTPSSVPADSALLTPSLTHGSPAASNGGASNGGGAVAKQPVMNGSTNNNNNFGMMNGGMMNGMSNMMMGSAMNGGGNMMNGNMMNGGNNMMNGNMMNGGNNMMMMNGTNTMMNATSNGNMMMMNGNTNGMNGMMMNQQQQPAMAMNMNVMQPMSNSISNNFGAMSISGGSSAAVPGGGGGKGGGGSSVATAQKADPFAGLGF